MILGRRVDYHKTLIEALPQLRKSIPTIILECMPLTDMPLDDLRTFRTEVAQPADFDDFWNAPWLNHARSRLRPR